MSKREPKFNAGDVYAIINPENIITGALTVRHVQELIDYPSGSHQAFLYGVRFTIKGELPYKKLEESQLEEHIKHYNMEIYNSVKH